MIETHFRIKSVEKMSSAYFGLHKILTLLQDDNDYGSETSQLVLWHAEFRKRIQRWAFYESLQQLYI